MYFFLCCVGSCISCIFCNIFSSILYFVGCFLNSVFCFFFSAHGAVFCSTSATACRLNYMFSATCTGLGTASAAA